MSEDKKLYSAGGVLVYGQRQQRRLIFWRLAAIIAAVLAIMALSSGGEARWPAGYASDHIARFSVYGVILDDQQRAETLAGLVQDESVKALIVHINSPGGSAAGSEALYRSLAHIAAVKPVVVVMGDVAASGGYMAALAGERIFANSNTITGSIGVIFQWVEAGVLMETLGLEPRAVRSGPLKARPDFYDTASAETITAIESLVDDSYNWFVALVARERQLTPETARGLADGRIYTGRQALVRNLVDAIGGEEEALDWLQKEKGVRRDLPVLDHEDSFFSLLAEYESSNGVIGRIAGALSSRPAQSGLAAVWQMESGR